MISKSYKKIITKEEYYKLLNLQNFHSMIMGILESIEEQSLNITQEIDENDPEGKLLFGGYTGDSLNTGTKEALDDTLKILDIEVEKDRIIENRKEIGKATKKKFKSGKWARNKSLDVHKEIIDSPILHDYLNDFAKPNVVVNEYIPDNFVLLGDPKKLISGKDIFDAIRNANFAMIDIGHMLIDENGKEIMDDMNKNDIFDYDNQNEDESGAMG